MPSDSPRSMPLGVRADSHVRFLSHHRLREAEQEEVKKEQRQTEIAVSAKVGALFTVVFFLTGPQDITEPIITSTLGFLKHFAIGGLASACG